MADRRLSQDHTSHSQKVLYQRSQTFWGKLVSNRSRFTDSTHTCLKVLESSVGSVTSANRVSPRALLKMTQPFAHFPIKVSGS